MPHLAVREEEYIEALQSDLDFARYERDLLLKEIMIKVRAGERIPTFMTRQQNALDAEIDSLVERLS